MQKELNSTSMTEHKTDMDITEKLNRTQSTIQLHFGEPNKGVTNHKTPHKKG